MSSPSPRRTAAQAVPFTLLLLLADRAPAQDPPASTLLASLAAPDVDLARAREVADQLRGRTTATRISLFDAMCRAYGEQARQSTRGRDRVVQRFTKTVLATQRARIGRNGARIDELRRTARSVTARADLTKDMIHAELDPVLAELRAMLLPSPAQVLEHDPELAAEVEALRRRAGELDAWHDLCLEAAHALDADDAGRKHVERAGLPPRPGDAASLDGEFARACVLGLELGAGDRRALEDNEALRARLDPAEFAGTLELNRIRIALGLNAVRIDEKLGNAARDHSRDMHTLGFFSHESPVPGKRTFGDRASRAGTSASSENIAQGHPTGEGAIEGWWYSPGHHKNMLGSHGRTGLGRHETTWTQLFGG